MAGNSSWLTAVAIFALLYPFVEVDGLDCGLQVCGTNAACSGSSCVCLPGYSGNPLTSCTQICTENGNCQAEERCELQLCVNACVGACGVNAVCTAVNHEATCECPPGYAGDPTIACFM